ncbi:MAG: hypothetical protein AB7I19_05040 [Planctomycetota bacterium]
MSAENFTWQDARTHLRACVDEFGPSSAVNGVFTLAGKRWIPPAVLPRPLDGEPCHTWINRLPETIGVQAVLLLRAGSAAMGVFADTECLAHRCRRRYVVRGNGKAQTTWIRTRGKSRYGSRLRLQNADRLLDDVATTTSEWAGWLATATAIHWSCPERQWAALHEHEPSLSTLRTDARARKIAFHVHEPRFEELRRVWWRLRHGHFEPSSPGHDDGG